jgi:predicted transcriptional regulator
MKKFQFFSSTKQLKKLWLLNLLHNTQQLTQEELARKIGITKSMVNRYLKLFKKEALLSGNYNLQLTKKGVATLYNLSNQYQEELNQLHNFIESEVNEYQELGMSEIRIAAIKSLGSMLPYLANELGILKDYSLKFNTTYYPTGQDLMQDFIEQDYDVGLLGIVPAFLWRTSGLPINIRAVINKGGHAIIAKDNIHSLEELTDKTVFVPLINDSVSDNLLKKLCQQKKIELNTKDMRELDFDLKDLINGNFDFDKVDALLLWEPYIGYLLMKNENLHLIYDFKEYHQDYSANVMISSQDKLDSNLTNLIEEIFKDTISEINNKPDLVIKKLSDFYNIETGIIKSALKRVEYTYIKEWEDE